jgi:voltage-gated sodium channel
MLKRIFLNDIFILSLIILNSIILFIGGFSISENFSFILAIADNLITSLFIIELIIKFRIIGIRKYFNSNWNRIDFFLIIISTPALIAFLFKLNVIDFSFLLIFRTLRIFKAFRFFKFIPFIGNLINGVKRALKASIFVFIGFFIYIFIIGILSYYLFSNSESKYFNDPLISLYSTFKIFTIEGWFEIPEEITKNFSKFDTFFTYLYFIFIVLTGGIFGLSLVNSIFVDSMVSDNNDDLEKKIDILDAKMSEILTKINNNETGKNS